MRQQQNPQIQDTFLRFAKNQLFFCHFTREIVLEQKKMDNNKDDEEDQEQEPYMMMMMMDQKKNQKEKKDLVVNIEKDDENHDHVDIGIMMDNDDDDDDEAEEEDNDDDDDDAAQRTAASIAVRGTYYNIAHESYYQAQIQHAKMVAEAEVGTAAADADAAFSEEEWDRARQAFVQPLPMAFRKLLCRRSQQQQQQSTQQESKHQIVGINDSDPQQQHEEEEEDIRFAFLQRLEQLVPDGALKSCCPIHLLPNPNHNKTDNNKNNHKNNDDDDLAALSVLASVAHIPPRQWSRKAQKALMDAQEVGAVARQEVCSMIPPLLLLLLHKLLPLNDPNDNDIDTATTTKLSSVLDLCAAPGSKSLQLLDMMMTMTTTTTKTTTQQSNGGLLLVCNDVNRHRLLTVTRRSRRQPSHYRRVTIMNSSDGRYFPALRKPGGFKYKFQYILVDVPCSGDGTLRKLSHRQWSKWNIRQHLQLHKLQCKLLTRALQCVEKGGRVVYSTCSLDPIEDEAVIVTALARCADGPSGYRIVPIRKNHNNDHNHNDHHNDNNNNVDDRGDDQLLLFPHSPGATQWIVPHPAFGTSVRNQSKHNNKTTKSGTTTTTVNDDDEDDVTTQQQQEPTTIPPPPPIRTFHNSLQQQQQQEQLVFETFKSIDQVPTNLRREEIVPSMFPPRLRSEENYRQALYLTMKEQQDEKEENHDKESQLQQQQQQRKDDNPNPQQQQQQQHNHNNNNNNDAMERKPSSPVPRTTTTIQEKLEQARKWGEILSIQEMDQLDAMLPNCARILPHHLDSGGFFCAVIERLPPMYYAVCYPPSSASPASQQGHSLTTTDTGTVSSSNAKADEFCNNVGAVGGAVGQYHGRILYPVQSAQQVRKLVSHDKPQDSPKIVLEGLATKDLALNWLKQHKCYRKGISEETISLVDKDVVTESPTLLAIPNEKNPTTKAAPPPAPKLKRHVNDPTKSIIYTPLFPSPHPALVAEFCNFFGLYTDLIQAEQNSVHVFPAHEMIAWTSTTADLAQEAIQVETCVEPQIAHIKTQRCAGLVMEKIPRKRRFLQLTLVSDEIRTLCKGGAKFSPMEIGLCLCWVPIPGRYREESSTHSVTKNAKKAGSRSNNKSRSSIDHDHDEDNDEGGKKVLTRFQDATERAVQSGRYGLLDEATEYIGRCATKRIVALTKFECLQLMKQSKLDVGAMVTTTFLGGNNESQEISENAQWQARWGKQLLADLGSWESGAVIAVVYYKSNSKSNGGTSSTAYYSNMFLSCVLTGSCDDGKSARRELQLLADQRLTDAYRRLLESY